MQRKNRGVVKAKLTTETQPERLNKTPVRLLFDVRERTKHILLQRHSQRNSKLPRASSRQKSLLLDAITIQVALGAVQVAKYPLKEAIESVQEGTDKRSAENLAMPLKVKFMAQATKIEAEDLARGRQLLPQHTLVRSHAPMHG